MDGVLVDSEPWWGEARQVVARRHGGDWTAADEAASELDMLLRVATASSSGGLVI